MRDITLPNGMTIKGITNRDTLLIYRDIFETKCYAKHVTIEAGDVVFDVGANVGLFALWLDSFGKKLDVYSFEPAPAIFDCLKANLWRMLYINPRLLRVGLLHKDVQVDLSYFSRFSQASTVYHDRVDRDCKITQSLVPCWLPRWMLALIRGYFLKPEVVKCEFFSLSSIMADLDIDRIDLLKIDAEGAEEAILAGIGDNDWPKIKQLIVEVHDGKLVESKIEAILKCYSYEVKIERNPEFASLALIYAVKSDFLAAGKMRRSCMMDRPG